MTLSLEAIARASEVIDPVFLDTPQFESMSLSAQLGCRLVVKVETLNPIGSFKGRGAHFLTSQLSVRPHLTCATSGNFGQGMAHAAPQTRHANHHLRPDGCQSAEGRADAGTGRRRAHRRR